MANSLKLVIAATALPAGVTGLPTCANAEAISESAITKSEAIIGGPSALAAILAEQGAPRRAAAAIQPASYALRPTHYGAQNPFMRTGDFAQTPQFRLSPAVYSGKPDIFGTVALKVGRTRMDDRWHKVERAPVSGAAAAFASSLRERDEPTRIGAINRYVNARVRFAAVDRQHGRADVWSNANSTLSTGRGDCEDYAIAKLQMLRTAGFADRDLYFVVLKDLVRRADHAIAVVRSGDRMYVLDNGTDRLLDTEMVSDYRPILTLSAAGAWTHGYRISRPAMVASADVTPSPIFRPELARISVRGAPRS